MGTVFTEGRHPGEFLLSEGNFHRSRDAVKIPASQTFDPCTVLGARVIPGETTSSASVAAGNAGNATIAVGAVSSTVKNGRYKGIANAATKVDWEDPAGIQIGTSTHGAAFTKGGVTLTITAGGTATVQGDEFYVDVGVESPIDLEYVPLNLAATDGTEVARAVALYGAATGAGETTKITAITRECELNGACLVFPAGITAIQKAKAVAELQGRGLIVR